MTSEKCSVCRLCTLPFLITEMERGFFSSSTLEKEGEDIEREYYFHRNHQLVRKTSIKIFGSWKRESK